MEDKHVSRALKTVFDWASGTRLSVRRCADSMGSGGMAVGRQLELPGRHLVDLFVVGRFWLLWTRVTAFTPRTGDGVDGIFDLPYCIHRTFRILHTVISCAPRAAVGRGPGAIGSTSLYGNQFPYKRSFRR